jgi:serine/threonine protein kinase
MNIKPAIPMNGSLADHLPNAENADFCQLHGPNRIAKIIAGIALAMRYVHSHNIVHRNLTPANVLLDWNWKVRIGGFEHSFSPNEGQTAPPTGDSHYLAPECYYNIIAQENDVFSFGLILYELVVGRPAFERSLTPIQIAGILVLSDWKPTIPDSVLPKTRELISDCLEMDYRYRLWFSDVLERLEKMRFKIISGVNSAKVLAFVNEIKARESAK